MSLLINPERRRYVTSTLLSISTYYILTARQWARTLPPYKSALCMGGVRTDCILHTQAETRERKSQVHTTPFRPGPATTRPLAGRPLPKYLGRVLKVSSLTRGCHTDAVPHGHARHHGHDSHAASEGQNGQIFKLAPELMWTTLSCHRALW